MRLDLLRQVLAHALAPKILVRDVERELRKILPPEEVDRVVGTMYGNAFRKAEAAYLARGSKGKQTRF